MKKQRLALSILALSLVLAGGLFMKGSEGIQAAPALGQPISSYFADPDLAQLVADRIGGGVTVDDVLTQTMIDYLAYDLQIKTPEITDLTGISTLSKLTVLVVNGDSGVTVIPEEVGTMTSLVTLSLNGLELTTLPDSFSGLTTLRSMDLNDNAFTVFPEELLEMSGLRYLWMNDNQLTALPAALGTYPRLSNLYDWGFEGSDFTDIPADTYNYLTGEAWSEGAWYYGFLGSNTATMAAGTAAIQGQEYRMDVFPVLYQFLDYDDNPGLTFTLIYPDGTSVIFTPTFDSGKMVIPGALITVSGNYRVEVKSGDMLPTGSQELQPAGINEGNESEFFANNSYTITFTANAAPAVTVLPQTGGLLSVLAASAGLLLGGALLVMRKKAE